MYFSILVGICGLTFPLSDSHAGRTFPPTFPRISVATCSTLWEICHNVLDTLVSCWNFAGMHYHGLKQGSRQQFYTMRSNIMLYKGTRSLSFPKSLGQMVQPIHLIKLQNRKTQPLAIDFFFFFFCQRLQYYVSVMLRRGR